MFSIGLTVFFLMLVITVSEVMSQLLALGAGVGAGSCRAFPYQVVKVDWEVCPAQVSCCSEYGYCRTEVSFM